MDCKHSADVNRRLARISGQVNGIREMVNEGRPCDELLIQLSSVSSAVTQVAKAHPHRASDPLCVVRLRRGHPGPAGRGHRPVRKAEIKSKTAPWGPLYPQRLKTRKKK